MLLNRPKKKSPILFSAGFASTNPATLIGIGRTPEKQIPALRSFPT
jgi:hypothetical protein